MDNSQNTLDKVIAWFFIVVILLIVGYGTYDTITNLSVWKFVLLLVTYIWAAVKCEEIYLKHIKKT
jgi:hypothetical protein